MSFLLDIQPNVVSRDLSGYIVSIYGDPKTGKTTLAAKFKKPLLLACEKGFSAIPGVMAMPINSWGDLNRVMRELKKPEVKEAFSTVILDTMDIAWEYAVRQVCIMSEVETIDKAYGGYGKGEIKADEMLNQFVREVAKLGYGVVMISHATDKTFKDESGAEFNQIVPTLPKRPLKTFESSADIYGYIRPVDTGELDAGGFPIRKTLIFTRMTPRFRAGSRFEHFPPSLELSYDNLCGAIADAVDAIAVSTPELTTEAKQNRYDNGLDFEQLKTDFQALAQSLMESGKVKPLEIMQIVEGYLGKGGKVATATDADAGVIQAIIEDLKLL